MWCIDLYNRNCYELAYKQYNVANYFGKMLHHFHTINTAPCYILFTMDYPVLLFVCIIVLEQAVKYLSSQRPLSSTQDLYNIK